MSAAVSNAFALLDDEGTVDAGALAAKIPVAKKEAPVKSEDTSKSGAPAARGGRASGGADRGRGRGPRPAARDSGEQNANDLDAGHDKGRSSRGGGRPRGGRAPRGGKREFDRHDASGRGHETEKRHGAGRGNWGAEGDEIKEATEKLNLEGGEEADADVPPPEEEEKQLTLEEYEALMAEKRAGLNAQREAAFKVDDSQFKGMKTHEKVEEDLGLTLNKNAKTVGANKAGRERERKDKEVVVDVGFKIQSAEERGPARGGRNSRGGDRRNNRGGSGRGGRQSGAGRGGRGGRGAAINVEDTNAFPSLG